MYRRLVLMLLPLLAATLAVAQETENVDPGAAEAKKLAGTWKLASLIRDGQEVPSTEIEGIELIVADNQYTYKGRADTRDQGTFKVDLSKKPPVIVTTKADDADKGTSVSRIYEWQDKDTIRFLTPGPGEELPKEFKSTKGSGREIAVWKRDTSKPK
jgi:uncharacterized protein (TIGR03067 family)